MIISRRSQLGTAAAVAVLLALPLAGCSGSSLDSDEPGTSNDGLVIGVVVPKSGPYQPIGQDMLKGWTTYLDEHGGKLGGHPVRVVEADEGDGGPTARAAADQLITAEHVDAIVGVANADAVTNIAGPATSAHVPFIGTGGRPSTLQDLTYTWHTSFASTDYGKAAGPYVRTAVDGPVYVIGPDYQGGKDQIGGFVSAFTAAGGKLANPGGQPTYTPWPGDGNFGPWLAKIKESGAKAVYAFYAGAPAVSFVKQYAQFGVGVPVYAPAFLTEGSALTAQGAAATGITTIATYDPTLDSPGNAAWVEAYKAKHGGAAPTVYVETMYAAGAVLDKAVAAAGTRVTSETINTAIGKVGDVTSPRGTWKLSSTTHTPVQRWCVRRVQAAGAGVANTVITQNLATVGG
ncbi:ABC transporter substrate-binding protein [Dactylosporangium sp. NPDC050688]|uniref:ABC transporter substrate-binding protein n=1 Tax=Dactylosporangium sp. NPDC050688 TaxID=3157217 RepID=UPI003409DE48